MTSAKSLPRPQIRGSAFTRRQLFSRGSAGIGVAALASLLRAEPNGLPHFTPKAKRVIYLHQAGGPSQMDLFDYKPALQKLKGTELPDSIRKGQRITGMTSIQKSLPVAPPLPRQSATVPATCGAAWLVP